MTSATLRMRVTLGKGIAWLLALLLAMISVAPILWIVVTSFKTFIQTQAIPPVWPSFTNIDNYVSQFSGSNSALGPLLRSLVVATVTMIITIVVAVPAAYSLARYRIVRKQDVQFWIISSRMMPLIAGVIPLAALLEAVHLYDTVPGLIIVYVGVNLSFAVWLLSIFFQNVPLEVEQAAHIDGLSRFGVLWHISIPLARASIFVVAIFTWILSWNELLDALVLTSGATETLPVFLSKFASNTLTAYQQMAAVATVQILPAVIITFFAQRYIVAGLSMGALSGE
jgi:ABC-type glycerol-3-phosphate transport system permease component